MTQRRSDPGAKRPFARPSEAELRAAKRVLSAAERRRVEDADKLCEDARRVLEAACVDADRRRAEAEQALREAQSQAQRLSVRAQSALDEARVEAQRVLDETRVEAQRVLDEARVEAQCITDEAAVAAGAAPVHEAYPPVRALTAEIERHRRDIALSAADPSVDDIGVLCRLLSDDLSADVRAAAVTALARTSEADQLGALALALADLDATVRVVAVERLPVVAMNRGAGQALAAAEDDDEAVRTAAYGRLATAPSWILWMALGRCSRRSELLAVLDQEAAERLNTLTLERLASPDVGDRVLALELTGHLGTPELIGEALSAFVDPDVAVRHAAATALASHQQAIHGLIAALCDDPAPDVRAEAARSLSSMGTDDALKVLVGALQDPHSDIRDVVAEGLLRHPSVGVARGLAAELTRANRDSVGEVLLGMGSLGREALAAVAAGYPSRPPSSNGALLDRASAANDLLDRSDTVAKPPPTP